MKQPHCRLGQHISGINELKSIVKIILVKDLRHEFGGDGALCLARRQPKPAHDR